MHINGQLHTRESVGLLKLITELSCIDTEASTVEHLCYLLSDGFMHDREDIAGAI